MAVSLDKNMLAQYATRIRAYALTHKLVSTLIIIAIASAGLYAYKKTTATTTTRYVLGTVASSTIISTISGSGQVSASRQVDIKPEVSGKITYIGVKPGQTIKAGTLIAQIDPSAAATALKNAQNDLETAKLNLEKLQAPADTLTITQAQNNLAKAQESKQDAQDDLAKAYQDGFNLVSSTFLDVPTIMTGLNSILFGNERTLGGSSQWNLDYYKNAIAQYDDAKASQYRDDAFATYNTAKKSYDTTFADYKATSATAGTSTIEALINEAYATTQAIASSVKSSTNLLQLYQDVNTTRNVQPAAISSTQLTSLGSYTTTINGRVSSLLNTITTIKNAKQAIAAADRTIAESQASLDKINKGADALDIRSDELTIAQRQDAVTAAQTTLAKYYIRAPFDGTIATVDAYIGDTGGSASIATIITKQQIATLSLNEVDAAKVAVGQSVTLTFDAISDLTLTGTIATINPLGTVNQGVVSYDAQIAFDTQDPRVKAGMTVNADIQTAVKQDVLSVPSSAIKTSNGVSSVQVFRPALTETGDVSGVTTSQTPETITVRTGISDDTTTEITAGLSLGEQIIVRTITGSTASKSSAASATSRSGFGGGAPRF